MRGAASRRRPRHDASRWRLHVLRAAPIVLVEGTAVERPSVEGRLEQLEARRVLVVEPVLQVEVAAALVGADAGGGHAMRLTGPAVDDVHEARRGGARVREPDGA